MTVAKYSARAGRNWTFGDPRTPVAKLKKHSDSQKFPATHGRGFPERCVVDGPVAALATGPVGRDAQCSQRDSGGCRRARLTPILINGRFDGGQFPIIGGGGFGVHSRRRSPEDQSSGEPMTLVQCAP